MASKKAKPAARVTKKPAKKKVSAKPAAKATKAAAAKKAPAAKAAAAAKKPAVKLAPVAKVAAAPVKGAKKGGKRGAQAASASSPSLSSPGRRPDGWMGPLPDKPLPRETRLPNEATVLTKREMEQVLTVGTRGVLGEGSLKGRLIVYMGFPYLEVIGRDKRELWFLLQGPDQEVLPAYVDHRVSVNGLIRRFHSYGGSVDVRKYSAKKPDTDVPALEPISDADRLRLLSPGEVVTIGNPGMGVGTKGFATLRGILELSGDEFYLVVKNAGTRQQVIFSLSGKGAKGLKRYVGETVVATGIVEKATGWGGTIDVESCEARAPEYPPVSRSTIKVTKVEGGAGSNNKQFEAVLNNGLEVRLNERQGWVWAIEPQAAKRLSLREVHLDHKGGSVREFFFTPRNPGPHELEFFLGKVHNPMNVSKTFKILVNVKVPGGLT